MRHTLKTEKKETMENGIVLTKESTSSDLERYFRSVLELDKQSKEYPVNLDDVWQLAYERKDNAVRALKTNFIENVDFIVIRNNAENSLLNDAEQDSDNSLAQNGKQDWGGSNKINYYLTSACLEYFIARKVRPVFEIYRKVFHCVAQGMIPSYQIEDPIERAKRWIKEQEEKKAIEEKNKEMQPKAEYFDNLVDKGLLTNFRDTAKEIGLKQNQFIKILIAKKYIYRDKQNHIKPYSQYNDDLFKMKDWGNDKATGTRTLITPKGKETFRLLFGNNNMPSLNF